MTAFARIVRGLLVASAFFVPSWMAYQHSYVEGAGFLAAVGGLAGAYGVDE